MAVIIGIFLAGGVHATKTTVRPVVTAASVGTGNWFVSLVEDIVAFFVSALAIFIPILAIAVMVIVVVWAIRFYLRRRRKTDALQF